MIREFVPLPAVAVLLAMCGTHDLLAALAQDFPTKPVRVIEPFGAGGGPDLVARAISPKLAELWGQPVTVENHPGAGGTAAPALVAKSPADGYTWLVNTSAQAYSATFLKNLPYDPLKDFIPVAPLTSQPYVLVAGTTTGITSVAELIAAAKANPGALRSALLASALARTWASRDSIWRPASRPHMCLARRPQPRLPRRSLGALLT